MRTRLLARRRAALTIDPSVVGPREFEFAHLLDARSRKTADVIPCATADLEREIDSILEKYLAAESVPEVISDDVQEAVTEVVPEVAVSRFADAGLDDDRLPLAVKRRRGRRR